MRATINAQERHATRAERPPLQAQRCCLLNMCWTVLLLGHMLDGALLHKAALGSALLLERTHACTQAHTHTAQTHSHTAHKHARMGMRIHLSCAVRRRQHLHHQVPSAAGPRARGGAQQSAAGVQARHAAGEGCALVGARVRALRACMRAFLHTLGAWPVHGAGGMIAKHAMHPAAQVQAAVQEAAPKADAPAAQGRRTQLPQVCTPAGGSKRGAAAAYAAKTVKCTDANS